MSTADVLTAIETPGVQVIDVRPIDAYNGWRLRGEPRGGHIRGARTLPLKWSDYLEWPELLQTKQLCAQQPLIIYGYRQDETEYVADFFTGCRYEDVYIYTDFVREWCGDDTLPMDRLPRYMHLVPPSWLARALRTGRAAEHAPSANLVVCHTHYQNRADYDSGHIPGAIDLDTNTLESPDTWNRRSPAEVRATLERLGITCNTTVVLYGRMSVASPDDPFPGSSAGQIAAFRCAFIMLWAGVKDVRVLNGGVHAWSAARLELTTNGTEPRSVSDFGADIPGAPQYAVDLAEARQILASHDANLVCVRSWREYIGQVSGYHYIARKGRIPGAVFAECGSDAYHMENYRNLDHTTREYGEIAASWKAAGITPDKYNAFYCGTGWRGSEAFFNAWLLGWPRVAVYDGGWYEWSSDERNPIETGIPGQQLASMPS